MTSPKGVIYHFSNQGTYGAKILYYTEMLDFTKAVGKGSRVQVDGFIFLILSSTSCCEMSENSREAGESQAVNQQSKQVEQRN